MTNSFSTKKVAAVAAGFAFAFSALFAGSASAQTAEELQAQIQNLLAMIAGLQAQLGTDDSAPAAGGSCTAMQFTLTHKQGDQGGEVMNIQKFLNANGFTVASAGAGSAGNETSYFGPATKAAVVKFQNAYASEVLAPVGLSAGTGYWGSSSRAKANAMEMAACAGSGSEDDDDDAPAATGEGVTVSAAAQPGNSLAPMSASNIPFTKFTLTAGEDDVDVENIVVELSGLASDDSFASVQLLDEDGMLVGSEESFDSDDQAEVGDDFTIDAGESMTFTVAATRVGTTTNTSGEIAAISVIAINTDATVNGSLPITGAQHTINESLTVASAAIDADGDLTNASTTVAMGDEDVDIATLDITANGEDIRVMSVRFYQDGSAELEDALDDVKAELNGDEYNVDIDGDYLIVDFGDGVVIEDGDTEALEVTATIVGGSSDTVQLELKEESDFSAYGEDYGYGVDGREIDEDQSVVIEAGDVSISKDADFEEETVAAGTDGAAMGGFTTDFQGENVTGDIQIVVEVAASSGVAADVEIDNLAIYMGDTRVSDREDVSFSSTTATTSVEFNNVELEADEDEIVYEIRGNIKTDAPDGTVYTIQNIAMDDIENESGDNVDNVDEVSLDQDTTVEGANFTMKLSSPSPAEINADKDGQLVAEIELDAEDSGDDIKVSRIELFGDSASTTAGEVDKCELFDGSESVSDEEDFANNATTTFSGLNLTVAAGESLELVVKCDMASAMSNGDTVGFDASAFDAEGVVTDTEFDGTAGSGSASVEIKAGTISAVLTSDEENDSKAVIEGANDVVLAIFEVEADDADVTVDSATTTLAGYTLVDGKVKLYIDGVLKDSEDAATSTVFTNLNIDIDNGEKVEFKFVADVETATGTVAASSVDLEAENGATTTASNSNTVTVSEALPVVAQVDVDSDELSTELDVTLFGFSVTAEGDDVVIASSTATATLTNATTSNEYWYVYDNADMTGSEEEKVAFVSGDEATIGVTVPEGETYYVFIVADVTTTADTRSIVVEIEDADGAIEFTPDVAANLVLEDDMRSLLKKD